MKHKGTIIVYLFSVITLIIFRAPFVRAADTSTLSVPTTRDHHFMLEAISEAEKRVSRFVPDQLDRDGYPRVGAVLVIDDVIMGRGFNESGRLLHGETYAILSALETLVWQDPYRSFISKLLCQKKLDQVRHMSKFYESHVTYDDILPDVIRLLCEVDRDLQYPLRRSRTHLYVTLAPCNKCQQLIGQLGIPTITAAHEALRDAHVFDATLYAGDYREGFMRKESTPLIREYRRAMNNKMQSIMQKRAKDSVYMSKFAESQMHKSELQKLVWAFSPESEQEEHYRRLAVEVRESIDGEDVVYEDQAVMLFLSKDTAEPFVDVNVNKNDSINIVWRVSPNCRPIVDDALDTINVARQMSGSEQNIALAPVRENPILRDMVADYISAYYEAIIVCEKPSRRESLHRFVHAVARYSSIDVGSYEIEQVIASFFVRYFLDSDIVDVFRGSRGKMRLVVDDIVDEYDMLYHGENMEMRSFLQSLRYYETPYEHGDKEEWHVMVTVGGKPFIFVISHTSFEVWYRGDNAATRKHSIVTMRYSLELYYSAYGMLPDAFCDPLALCVLEAA